MATKKNMRFGVLIFLAAIILLLFIQGLCFAEGRIVYIYGVWDEPKTPTMIEPKVTLVGRNTTVIWLNESQVDVKLIFLQGKTCKQIARVQEGWSMRGTCYITNFTIPPGGTTSAFFNDIGTFDYEVEYVGKNHKEKGSLRVGTHAIYPR